MMTAELHQSLAQSTIDRAITLLADVMAPAREWAAEHGYSDGHKDFTIGFLTGTVGHLLDALGFPEHGPNEGQWSWLPEPDDDEDGAA